MPRNDRIIKKPVSASYFRIAARPLFPNSIFPPKAWGDAGNSGTCGWRTLGKSSDNLVCANYFESFLWKIIIVSSREMFSCCEIFNQSFKRFFSVTVLCLNIPLLYRFRTRKTYFRCKTFHHRDENDLILFFSVRANKIYNRD